MPGRLVAQPKNGEALREIVSPSTEAEFLDHLIDGIKDSDSHVLLRDLENLASDRDADIEFMCTGNHHEFVTSVNKLDSGRADCTTLGNEILGLVQSYQRSTDNLAAQKKNLVDSRSVRQNVDESAEALKECIEVLKLANQVHDLVAKQNHYAALRALDELQLSSHIRESSQYKISDLIERSIPATQKMIAEAVMSDLNTWLYRIRDVSQYIGEVAFYHTEQRRTRHKERAAEGQQFGNFRLNAPLELAADESEEYDSLDDDEAEIHVDFTPLFECIHIHEALGQNDRFRSEYANTRRRQRDLIIPSALKIDDEEASELKTLLESISGFCIIERATLSRTQNLRTQSDVDELWDSMCQSAVTIMSSAIHPVDSAETLLRITGVVSLFIQTMESHHFYASALNTFLLSLFERYTQLMKRRISDDFDEIVSSDDYMPMPINNLEDYDKIIDVGWYVPDKDREDISFPVVLPFSQMYPMCCIDIRNFLNQVWSAPDEYLQRSNAIDETIRRGLDELLCDKICQPLVEKLTSQYPGQIVQILTNLEHFENTCEALQKELAEFRTSRSQSGPVILRATERFRMAKSQAEQRIFELVNSKIDDLLRTSDYDWSAMSRAEEEASDYMTEFTRYLSNMMGSVLLGLPTEIKHLIYFEALSHAAAGILALPLSPSITSITPAAVHRLSTDVLQLASFVSSLSLLPAESADEDTTDHSSILRRTVDELTQTVALMASPNPDEFYDIGQRNKKFGSVNAQNGALLLEKVERGKLELEEKLAQQVAASDAAGSLAGMNVNLRAYGERAEEARLKASERFGNVWRGFSKGTESGGN